MLRKFMLTSATCLVAVGLMTGPAYANNNDHGRDHNAAIVRPSSFTLTSAQPQDIRIVVPGLKVTPSKACFSFTFGADQLDPGEFVGIEFQPGVAAFSVGFENIGVTPQASRTLCLQVGFQPGLLANFSSGRLTVELVTNGSVAVQDLDVVVTI